jgi:rhodanese-related sulfurtransferase
VSRIRPAELDARLGGDDAQFVLDVREREAFRGGHVEWSHNVPVHDALRAGDGDALRRHLDEVPRDRDVVTVCGMGVVARRATRVLESEGYDAATLAGGLSGWRGYRNDTLGHRLRSLLRRLR